MKSLEILRHFKSGSIYEKKIIEHLRKKREVLNVMILDDDNSFLKLINLYFSELDDVSLLRFSEEEEFIDALSNKLPDLLIIDVNLNYGSGIDLASLIKDIPGADMPILIVSGQEILNEMLPANLHRSSISILSKPVQKGSFLNTCVGLLNMKSA